VERLLRGSAGGLFRAEEAVAGIAKTREGSAALVEAAAIERRCDN
jgi:hypothetical protein